MMLSDPFDVVPAKAGTHSHRRNLVRAVLTAILFN